MAGNHESFFVNLIDDGFAKMNHTIQIAAVSGIDLAITVIIWPSSIFFILYFLID